MVTWWGCVMPVGTVPRVAVRKDEHLRDVMTLTLT